MAQPTHLHTDSITLLRSSPDGAKKLCDFHVGDTPLSLRVQNEDSSRVCATFAVPEPGAHPAVAPTPPSSPTTVAAPSLPPLQLHQSAFAVLAEPSGVNAARWQRASASPPHADASATHKSNARDVAYAGDEASGHGGGGPAAAGGQAGGAAPYQQVYVRTYAAPSQHAIDTLSADEQMAAAQLGQLSGLAGRLCTDPFLSDNPHLQPFHFKRFAKCVFDRCVSAYNPADHAPPAAPHNVSTDTRFVSALSQFRAQAERIIHDADANMASAAASAQATVDRHFQAKAAMSQARQIIDQLLDPSGPSVARSTFATSMEHRSAKASLLRRLISSTVLDMGTCDTAHQITAIVPYDERKRFPSMVALAQPGGNVALMALQNVPGADDNPSSTDDDSDSDADSSSSSSVNDTPDSAAVKPAAPVAPSIFHPMPDGRVPTASESCIRGLVNLMDLAPRGNEPEDVTMARIRSQVATAMETHAAVLALNNLKTQAQATSDKTGNLGRKPPELSPTGNASSWVRSVQTWARATNLDIDSTRALALIETYLSPAIAQRWEQRKATLQRASKVVTFADLRTCVLTSQDGIHPADSARKSFSNASYNSNKTLLENLTYYRHLYDTMVTTCASTRVMPLASYDLYCHLLQFIDHGPRSIHSVVLASAQRAIAAREESEGFVTEDSADFYSELFDNLLNEAQSLARLSPKPTQTRNQQSQPRNMQAERGVAAATAQGRPHARKRLRTGQPVGTQPSRSSPSTPSTSSHKTVGALLSTITSRYGDRVKQSLPGFGKTDRCLFCGAQDHRTFRCDASTLAARLAGHPEEKRKAALTAIKAVKDV